MKTFTIEDVLKMLRQTKLDNFEKRKISLHISDGYGSPENRTTFFCVEGSPNKINGWIVSRGNGFELSANNKSYYFSDKLQKVSKNAVYYS